MIQTSKNTIQFFFQRIIHTRSFWLIQGVLLVIMTLDVFHQVGDVVDVEGWGSTFFFARSIGNSHLYQLLVITILPVYIFFAVSSCYLSDYTSGFQISVVNRIGLKQYLKNLYGVSFFAGTLVLLIPLIYNIVLIKILLLFDIKTITMVEYMGFDRTPQLLTEPSWQFAIWQVNHGFLTWLIFSFTVCLFSGALAVTMITISRLFLQRYQVVIVTLIAYFAELTLADHGGIIGRGIQPNTPITLQSWLLRWGLFFVAVILFNVGLDWWLKGEEQFVES